MWALVYEASGSRPKRQRSEPTSRDLDADERAELERLREEVAELKGASTHSIPDRVKRLCDTGELNQVWMSDSTYVRTRQGWLYLCVVRDGCSRRVPGWAMDPTQTTDVVERALRMAHT